MLRQLKLSRRVNNNHGGSSGVRVSVGRTHYKVGSTEATQARENQYFRQGNWDKFHLNLYLIPLLLLPFSAVIKQLNGFLIHEDILDDRRPSTMAEEEEVRMRQYEMGRHHDFL